MIIDYMVDKGFATTEGKPTERAKEAVIEQTIALPPQLEAARSVITRAIENATTVTTDNIVGQVYTETVKVEKTVSYDEAAELMTHFENKGYGADQAI